MENDLIITPSKDSKLIPTLVEFAYAEYGSALEMLAAAKLTSSPKLKVGYINHALDEYRHAQLIFKIIDTQLKVSPVNYEKGFRFLPLNVVQKGYVDKDGFLVEKLKNKAFVEFVFSNEYLAKEAFQALSKRVKDSESKNILQNIMDEEDGHAESSVETLDEIMIDEDKHWGLAKKYHEKAFPKANLKIAFFRERVKNKMRLFYLKNFKILGYIFNPIIKFIVILFGWLINILRVPNTNGVNMLLGDKSSVL